MYHLFRIIIVVALFNLSLGAKASVLDIELNNVNYGVGDSVIANVYFSDIAHDSLGQIPLAAFEFDLTFDDSLLAFSALNFGTSLDTGFFPSDQYSSLLGSTLTVGEFSFDDSFDLAAIQLPTFLLASVSFTALRSGDEMLSLVPGLFSDGAGNAANFNNIAGTNALVSVAEPSLWSLLLCGLLFIAVRARGVIPKVRTPYSGD